MKSEIFKPLVEAIEEDKPEAVRDLLFKVGQKENGYLKALLDEANEHGETPLHIAAKLGKNRVIPVLFEFGASVNCTTETKKLTPLHLAVKNGNTDTVTLLIAKGAEVNARDSMLVTPLLCAASSGSGSISPAHIQCIAILIKHGADITIPGVISDRSYSFVECLRNECLQKVVHQLKTFVRSKATLKNLVSDKLLTIPSAKADIIEMVDNYDFREKILRQDKVMPFLSEETRKAVEERQDLWEQFSTHFFKPTFSGNKFPVTYGQEGSHERNYLINHLYELIDCVQGKVNGHRTGVL